MGTRHCAGLRPYASRMESLVSYPTQIEAEMARARLEDEGILAAVSDWSAMRELMDYRVFVPADRLAEAAEILGIEPPAEPGPQPEWLPKLLAFVTFLLVGFLVWGLLGG